MDEIKKITTSIRKLKRYQNAAFPILSVYLNFAEARKCGGSIEQFEKLITGISQSNHKDSFTTETVTIEGYLQTIPKNQNYKGLAIFAGGKTLWEVINHDFTIASLCYASHSPFLIPLITKLREQNRYLIILADREKADFLTIKNNIVEDFQEFSDPSVPPKVKSNKEDYYARNNIILRHIDVLLYRHLQKISQQLDRFMKGKTVSAVLVGGHQPLLHKIEKHLNPLLQEKVIGEFITELNIPKNDLVRHCKAAIARVNSL